MSDVTFLPSAVYPCFPHSRLLKGEKEAIAAMLVAYLASHGNKWEEVEWPKFLEFARSGKANVFPAYLGMFDSQLVRATLGQIGVMVKEEYLLYRNDEQAKVEYLAAGPKLLEFYKDYVQPATV